MKNIESNGLPSNEQEIEELQWLKEYADIMFADFQSAVQDLERTGSVQGDQIARVHISRLEDLFRTLNTNYKEIVDEYKELMDKRLEGTHAIVRFVEQIDEMGNKNQSDKELTEKSRVYASTILKLEICFREIEESFYNIIDDIVQKVDENGGVFDDESKMCLGSLARLFSTSMTNMRDLLSQHNYFQAEAESYKKLAKNQQKELKRWRYAFAAAFAAVLIMAGVVRYEGCQTQKAKDQAAAVKKENKEKDNKIKELKKLLNKN